MPETTSLFTFDGPGSLLLGALTGLVFGFLLQKGGVTRYGVIVGQFLLKDFTVLKVMLTAIVVGAAGIWGMRAMGMEFPMHIKSALLAGNILGGVIFGVGMAVLGYCPGTGVAALGDGSRHAIPGVLGMLFGGAVFAETFPLLKDNVLAWAGVTATVGAKATDKVTASDLTGLSPWWFIALLALVAGAIFFFLERWESRRRDGGPAGSLAAPRPAASV